RPPPPSPTRRSSDLQVDHLHQDHVQTAAVQADGVHRALHPGHMAVVVGAPDVDGPVKAAGGQLVVVVGDVGGKVGGDAVGPDQDLVLVLLGGAVVGLFLVGRAVLGGVLGAAVQDGAILALVAGAFFQQQVHHLLHGAGLVQGALGEPYVVLDAVFAQVLLEGGDVLGQGVAHQGVLQGGKGFALIQGLVLQAAAGQGVLVPLPGGELQGQQGDVPALVALLGQGIGRLVVVVLQIADGQALAKLLDLVAGVVDVELPGDVVACPLQDGGQAVAQGAAPGVAHVHGAGGVGRDELDVVLLALAVIGPAVVGGAAGRHDHASPEGGGQEQVDEAWAGHLGPGEAAVRQAGQVGQQGLGDHFGGLAPGAGPRHGDVGGDVAVLRVGRHLHDEGGQLGGRQVAGLHGGLGGLGQQGPGLGQGGLPGVVV